MLKVLAAVLVLLLASLPAHAAEEAPADILQSVIDEQLDAFARDDGPGAYAFAAPLIQKIFPSPGQFMDMVKFGYQPVYRNTARRFVEAFVTPAGQPAQKVLLTGLDGKTYEATYTFERQPDGSWKISGCYLAEVPATDV
jgi:hypothetical protein